MVQKSNQLELSFNAPGEARRTSGRGQTELAVPANEYSGNTCLLMERVVERENLKRALHRVRQNKGSPGVDGMNVDDLLGHLQGAWKRIRKELLGGTFTPQPVRRHLIDKQSGGKRELGIPTVLDRFIQQALLQVLQPMYDETFSDHSHGFRPGRSTHGAIREAQAHIQRGKHVVVDVDLEKFFDRVSHDVLMGRLAKRIGDKRILGLIRHYLSAGVMDSGVVIDRYQGTPQGGPLSPLLANILLDEVDKELERRGHVFVRYAEDLRVFVYSKKAGERVMHSLVTLFGTLRLQVNARESAVDEVWRRPFLGFSYFLRAKSVRLRVSRPALDRMKRRVRKITARCGGRSMVQVIQSLRRYLPGWRTYFCIENTKTEFRDLDRWIRRRLRAMQLRQWKRGSTILRELRLRGVPDNKIAMTAMYPRRWWRNSRLAINRALTNRYFDRLGLPRLERTST